MGHRAAGWLVMALLCQPAAAWPQEPSASSLVVVVDGESVYHEVACPLVAKAGSHVTVMKRAEAVRRGLTAHDCETAADEQPKKNANTAIVFTQPGDRHYHKAGCRKLTSAATKSTLDEAGQKYWPCPVCKPPIRKRVKAIS